MNIKQHIQIEPQPTRRLMPLEWVVLAYAGLTMLMVLFTYTRLPHPEAMVWERVRLAAITLGIWAVYQLLPCRLTRLLRVLVQTALLATWYPDTYELNRVFPNLDHHFALMDQELFGFQPALTFSAHFPSIWVSELMDMGYASYYPMIVVVLLYYYAQRYQEFERCAWMVLASFFAYYVVYDLLPVVGPTYYYKAVGLENIRNGVFPSVGAWFDSHTECLPSPGWTEGFFHQLVVSAKAAGERPTAAFPSSHVGISTLCMLLLWRTNTKWLWRSMLPLYVLLCLATVYIQAHYAVDALAGLLTGILSYWLGLYLSSKMPSLHTPYTKTARRKR